MAEQDPKTSAVQREVIEILERTEIGRRFVDFARVNGLSLTLPADNPQANKYYANNVPELRVLSLAMQILRDIFNREAEVIARTGNAWNGKIWKGADPRKFLPDTIESERDWESTYETGMHLAAEIIAARRTLTSTLQVQFRQLNNPGYFPMTPRGQLFLEEIARRVPAFSVDPNRPYDRDIARRPPPKSSAGPKC